MVAGVAPAQRSQQNRDGTEPAKTNRIHEAI